ncbi:E3 ubiquitin-protein ligase [Wickerhamomyces ciferrii]|uniref:E3 ubiquitin-protein ligase n=1 Tax=Wickerhamomyces ciferrii (strain ATCC 14091 / BCRC 22168 / CBS 111 / JCM 3599 / NBRC 0793 / NRRL Y-1031 F-60-10) TaxID=1206466 RepID=K0KIN9_WICCF|nr:E3 ubiquitin-protein ligase [Wickerhamomyces ciferrii]CCH42851.1 E3 ubiquitin-protein ligase [Wickerhamomyces ciferrii]
MHFYKLLIPITFITILAFSGSIQALPVPQDVSESIMAEEVPIVSNSSIIDSNHTIEETTAFNSSALNDDEKPKPKEGLQRQDLNLIIIFSSVFGPIIYLCFIGGTLSLYARNQYLNFFEMIEYIGRDVEKKKQSWFWFLVRVLFSWKTLGVSIIIAGLGLGAWYGGKALWISFKYLINGPIKAFFKLKFVKGFFSIIATPFKNKEYPSLDDESNNSKEISTGNISNKAQGKIVKRSQVDQYNFNGISLRTSANDIFSPEFQCCTELTGDDLYAACPEHSTNLQSCSICLEQLRPEDILLLLPCNHAHHRDCLYDFKRSTVQETHPNEVVMFRCPSCQLNLVRLYQYYVDHDLDFKKVKFDNRG